MTTTELLHRLASLEVGWASVAEITCTLEPEDRLARSEARRLLGHLARSGALRSVYVRHRSEPLLCVYLDSGELRQLAMNEG